jgi:hypothetical protein
LSRDSFSGTNLSHIRRFLNRLLALHGQSSGSGVDTSPDTLAAAFDLGDDVADPTKTLEEGSNFTQVPDAPRQPPADPDLERQAQQRHARQRRANRDQLIEAVASLQQQVAEKAQQGRLTAIDLLRLRAMLMIILAAGWDGVSKAASTLQVLPPSGDANAAWPRLLGKCLFAYFGGSAPVIRKLVVEDYYDQIPDILECWAGCLWAIQAIAEIAAHTGAGQRPVRRKKCRSISTKDERVKRSSAIWKTREGYSRRPPLA